MKQVFNLLNKNTLKGSFLSQLKYDRLLGYTGLNKVFSTVYVNHRNLKGNDEQAPFDFTEDNYKKVEEIMNRYPKVNKKSAIMPLLWLAQKQNNNYITLQAMQKIAKILEVPDMAVYEVASFYTMYNRFPVGKFHLQICGTTPCMVRGAKDVIKAAMDNANVAHMGEVSKDELFCISEVECLGACVNAPMMQVNNEWFYEDLNAENIVKVMDSMRNGEDPAKGPQIKRNFSEGPLGRTSLNSGFKDQPVTRDFAEAKRLWEESKAKEVKK